MPTSQPLSPEEQAEAALNEQGFLLAHAIRETIAGMPSDSGLPTWRVAAAEYSVTAVDQSQTRIDLVIQSRRAPGAHLCIECKRSNPLYKQWLLFDPEPLSDASSTAVYFESFEWFSSTSSGHRNGHHAMSQCHCPSSFPVYRSYLEAAIVRDGKGRVSACDTIEAAFLQVTRGQTGFMAKQIDFSGPPRILAIPVVVTTAQLYEVQYDARNVIIESGTIDRKSLNLRPLKFCAVDYHANDSLAVRSRFAPSISNFENDLRFWQKRTTFVVQSKAILEFLAWLDTTSIVRQ